MNRWYFWVLAPLMLATALVLPIAAKPPTWQGSVILYVICGTLMIATLGLAKPRRFRWALRVVAGTILLAYLGYAATETVAWWQGKPFAVGANLATTSLANAIQGLLVFGLPSLYFLFRGRTCRNTDALLDVNDNANGPCEERLAVGQANQADKYRQRKT